MRHWLLFAGLVLAPSSQAAVGAKVDAKLFRQIFSAALQETHPGLALDRVLYAPTPPLLEKIAEPESGAEACMRALELRHQGVKVRELFEEGQRWSAEGQALLPEEITARLRKNPVTLVIDPGVFGEFIESVAFQEAFNNPHSSFAREFRAQMEAHGACQGADDPFCDERFAVSDLRLDPDASGLSRVRLDNVIKATSLDDTDGTPLVRVVIFHTETLSLESLGGIEGAARNFSRRLDRFFQVMGLPENLTFLGYSRGFMVGLEMLSQAQAAASAPAWLERTRQMVSLGGVGWGSALADEVLRSGGKEALAHEQLEVVKRLAQNLQRVDNVAFTQGGFSRWTFAFRRAWRKWKNAQAWTRAFEEMLVLEAKALSAHPSLPDFLERLHRLSRGTDPRASLGLILRVARHYGLLAPCEKEGLWGRVGACLRSVGNFMGADYSLNIVRFQRVVKSVTQAVEEMSTAKRMEWWRSARLPTQVRYATVAGVMDDPLEPENIAHEQLSFSPDSEDYGMLLDSYRQYRAASGQALNDSQVAVPRTQIWPALAGALNPAHEGLSAELWAVAGAHHWALALNRVNDRLADPFPRLALLKAIAAASIWDAP